jgi:hypothetical protein
MAGILDEYTLHRLWLLHLRVNEFPEFVRRDTNIIPQKVRGFEDNQVPSFCIHPKYLCEATAASILT